MSNSIRRIRLPGVFPEPISHYTDAVIAGNILWISGTTGNRADKEIAVGDVVAQATDAYEQIGAMLENVGSTFADVIKTTTYVTNIDDWKVVNAVRKKFFGDSLPAATLIEVSRLATPELLIEIDVVALVNNTQSN